MLLFSPKTTIFWTQRVYSRSWAFPVTRNRCVVRSSFYEPACYISLETRTICFLSLARICFKRTRLWRKKRICRLKKKAILSELLRRKNAVPLRIGFHGWRTRYDNFGLLTIIGYCVHVNLCVFANFNALSIHERNQVLQICISAKFLQKDKFTELISFVFAIL